MVVRLSVGIIRSVVEVECDIEEVDDLEVSLDSDVQSILPTNDPSLNSNADMKTSFISRTIDAYPTQ